MTFLQFVITLWLTVYCSSALASTPKLENNIVKTTSNSTITQNHIKINLNTASVKELQQIKGISAYKARAIVAYRKLHGAFKSNADLNKVRGFLRMKAEKLAELQNQLSV